jgi:hypothetical protein
VAALQGGQARIPADRGSARRAGQARIPADRRSARRAGPWGGGRVRRATTRDWLPLAKTGRVAAGEPTGDAFDSAWIDFENGIRVGNLEPEERITRILKHHLESLHGVPFVTDRWGRGVFWQWICWVPRPNRDAKPVSHDANWGSAKYYITIDRQRREFAAGMTVERGYVEGPEARRSWGLREDWDWHRLLARCRKGGPLDVELARLLREEGFVASLSGGAGTVRWDAAAWTSALAVRRAAARCPAREWAGFNLFYPMSEEEVRATPGPDLVRAVKGACAQLVPAMNLCLDVPLAAGGPRP